MNNTPLEELPRVYAFLDAVGLPKDKFYYDMVYEWLQKGMTVEEALTEQCEGFNGPCSSRIIHRTAKWRFQLSPIRCGECAKKALAAGYDWYDAMYVD